MKSYWLQIEGTPWYTNAINVIAASEETQIENIAFGKIIGIKSHFKIVGKFEWASIWVPVNKSERQIIINLKIQWESQIENENTGMEIVKMWDYQWITQNGHTNYLKFDELNPE